MPFDLFIFDFDGTLVDSTAAKAAAFYQLLPGDPAWIDVVSTVLAEDPEGSRERVIRRMLVRLGRLGQLEAELRLLVSRYTELTDHAVGNAPEFPDASNILRALRRAGKLIYVSSNTPERTLGELLRRRGWLPLLDGVAGYPSEKTATARRLLQETCTHPRRTAIIGDGESDRTAAEAVGAQFFRIRRAEDLQTLKAEWGL